MNNKVNKDVVINLLLLACAILWIVAVWGVTAAMDASGQLKRVRASAAAYLQHAEEKIHLLWDERQEVLALLNAARATEYLPPPREVATTEEEGLAGRWLEADSRHFYIIFDPKTKTCRRYIRGRLWLSYHYSCGPNGMIDVYDDELCAVLLGRYSIYAGHAIVRFKYFERPQSVIGEDDWSESWILVAEPRAP